MDADAGKIVGKPTLMVKFGNRLDANRILEAIRTLNYPLEDVSVYYRVTGTDQVIDALTGMVAAGQALSDEDARGLDLNTVETIVLMHPNGEQFVATQTALRQFGEADYLYAERTVAGTEPGAISDVFEEGVPRPEAARAEVPRAASADGPETERSGDTRTPGVG